MILVIAEKPSVAKAIGRALRRHGVEAEVIGLRGHLTDLDLPDEFGWRLVDPSEIFSIKKFKTVVKDEKIYERLLKVLERDLIDEIVIATDNDSEGELIGFEVLKLLKKILRNDFKISRMRFNSVDEGELWKAWNEREPTLNQRWVEKAEFRRSFDLVTGAAFTRLLTLSARKHGFRGLISWGSCQTPTLNYLVRREEQIIGFKPKIYWRIKATLSNKDGERLKASSKRFEDGEKARKIFESIKSLGKAYVMSYEESEKMVQRPKPLRTDEMLQELNRITGRSASMILRVAEELYSEGFISYPRTETNKWPKNFDHEIPTKALIRAGLLDEERVKEPKPLQGRLDDRAHPPIYPIKAPRRDGSLRWRVWEYIARRYAANVYYRDSFMIRQKAWIRLGELTLSSEGLRIIDEGFYEIFRYFRPKEDPMPVLKKGKELLVLGVELAEERSKPPPRLSESTLLKLMERDRIGTDATRADYPRILLDRGYAIKMGKVLKPTKLGLDLIKGLRAVDDRLVSPKTRRMIEEYMERIAEGRISREKALEEALNSYSELFEKLRERISDISLILAGSSGAR